MLRVRADICKHRESMNGFIFDFFPFMSCIAWNRCLGWVTQFALCSAIPLPQPFLSVSDSKCQRGWICSHWDIHRLPEWLRRKKNQPLVNLLGQTQDQMCLLLPFVIYIYSISNISTVLSHTEKLFFWLNYWKSPRNVCVLCWFPDSRDVLVNTENSLILGSASNQALNFEGSCQHHDIPPATESPDLCLQTTRHI